MTDDSAKRARIAYDAFLSGFDHDGSVPHWSGAPTWVRDVVLVAYLQGKLDAPNAIPTVAATAPEPVGWEFVSKDGEHGILTKNKDHAREWARRGHEARPVYTSPLPRPLLLRDEDHRAEWPYSEGDK